MEQQSHSSGKSESLPDFSTDSFPNGASIEHSAECVEVPFQNNLYIIPYKVYSDSYGYDLNSEAYLDGMGINRNIENFLKDDVLLPFEQNVEDYDDYECVPLESLNNNLVKMDKYEWHKEDFYNGANFETINVKYSTDIPNYTSYFRGGAMYFIPHRNTSNGLRIGYTTYAQSQPVLNTGTQYQNVAHVEAELNSTYTENSRFDSNVESHEEATKPETPRTDAINAESRLEPTNTEIPNIDYTSEIKTPSGTTKVETILEKDVSELADNLSECLVSDSSNTESRLEAKNTEIPNIDYTSEIKTPPGTMEAENILERDVSELTDTLSECLISGSSNTGFQPNTSNSNSALTVHNNSNSASCIDKESNYEGSLNSNNLSNGQNSGGCNSDEHVDGKNVNDHVENGGQTFFNRNNNRRSKRDNSRKASGNNGRRGDSTVISLKNLNSRRNSPSSSEYNSLNTKHLNDRNGGNGLENADSRQDSRRNNGNSDAARSLGDFQSSEGCNGTCCVHCDIESYDKSPENCKTSDASSELHKNNGSYSAAVKRSLN